MNMNRGPMHTYICIHMKYLTRGDGKLWTQLPAFATRQLNKNGLLHEDEYVDKLLMEATAVVEQAEKRQDSEMGDNDEDELYSFP